LKFKKKILIFGGSGLAGLNFIKLFSKKYKILASYNLNKPKISKFQNIQFLKIDILSPYKEIKKQVKLFKPNYVFNFSAISEVDLCERNKKFCKKVLFEGFKKALKIAKCFDSKFVQISTDTIFDQKNIINHENSKLDHKNYYSYLKIHCEKYLAKNYSNFIILRGRFFGYSITKKNFFEQILIKLRKKNKIFCYDNMYSTPIEISNFCKILEILLSKKKKGIFNISSNIKISRYTFAKQTAKIFNLDNKLIIRTKYLNKENIDKPLNSSISNKKIKKIKEVKIMSVIQSLKKLKHEEKNSSYNSCI